MQSMASNEEANEDILKPDLSSLHQLLYSIGRLKFSLRSLAVMQMQASLLPEEETDCIKDNVPLPESNSILEKIINEIVSKRSNSKENTIEDPACGITTQDQCIASIEELEIVSNQLQNELQRIRQHYQTAFRKLIEENAI